jgi:hypothetical protein
MNEDSDGSELDSREKRPTRPTKRFYSLLPWILTLVFGCTTVLFGVLLDHEQRLGTFANGYETDFGEPSLDLFETR